MPTAGRAWKIAFGGALGVAVAALVILTFQNLQSGGDGTLITIAPLPTTQAQTVTVFVGGAVANPGVYTLPRGERVEGAIAAAGGFSPEADHDGVNRAKLLRDEENVVVPRRGEPTATPARAVTGSAAPSAAPRSPTASASAPAPGPIDVNAATAAELEQLPGVGAKIAQEIVTYREANGRFANAVDLAKVSGISERMVAEWGDKIIFGP